MKENLHNAQKEHDSHPDAYRINKDAPVHYRRNLAGEYREIRFRYSDEQAHHETDG